MTPLKTLNIVNLVNLNIIKLVFKKMQTTTISGRYSKVITIIILRMKTNIYSHSGQNHVLSLIFVSLLVSPSNRLCRNSRSNKDDSNILGHGEYHLSISTGADDGTMLALPHSIMLPSSQQVDSYQNRHQWNG